MKSPTLSALLYVVVFVYLFIQLFGFSISLSISNILDNAQSHNQYKLHRVRWILSSTFQKIANMHKPILHFSPEKGGQEVAERYYF